jgi:capsular exopolysaccharide synthesis family protein
MSKFYQATVRATKKVKNGANESGMGPEVSERSAWAIQIYEKVVEDGEVDQTSDVVEEDRSGAGSEPMSKSPSGSEAEISKTLKREPSALHAVEESIHPAYERIIQSLSTFRRSPAQGIILFASAVPREGTSTTARNTAVALGRGGSETVVLVDANLREPSQHHFFGTELTDGLSDVLRGPTSLATAVRADVAPGLSLLTAGEPHDSPPRLMTASALQGVTMALTSFFEWVIVDGPPLTRYPEAASLAASAGGALLVIRAERTRQEVAEEAKKVLADSGVDVLGAVLNRRKFHIPDFIYRRL